MGRLRVIAALAAAVALLGTGSATGSAPHQAPQDVVLVTFDCEPGNLLCGPFRQAIARTGARGRIVTPDDREDPVSTLALLAQQGHDLIVVNFGFADALAVAAKRFPEQRFALLDAPLDIVDGRPANVTAVVIQANEAAYLAGWLAGRTERSRRGPDVVGAVGGQQIPPVQDITRGFRAGALRAAPGATVLVDYTGDFVDPSQCAAAARRQVARGAGVLADVAGRCGVGTLDTARRSGVWGVGVDSDQAGRGSHILTSVVKRYDRAIAILVRRAAAGTPSPGRTVRLGLRVGGSELGRISPRVPAATLAGLAAVRRGIVAGRIEVPTAIP